MIRFTIDWENISSGYKFTADYVFDGCATQKGYDLISWSLNVLRYGQKEGFRAIGNPDDKYHCLIKLLNPADYPEFADKLFQAITVNSESLVSLGAYC